MIPALNRIYYYKVLDVWNTNLNIQKVLKNHNQCLYMKVQFYNIRTGWRYFVLLWIKNLFFHCMEMPFKCLNKINNRKFQFKSIKINKMSLKMVDNNNTLNQIPNPVFTCKMSNLRLLIKEIKNIINPILISMAKRSLVKLFLLLNQINISNKSKK